MFILHIALQGCLKSGAINYGLTPDTGGHIRYLLELTEASVRDENVERIDIVTRGFEDARLGSEYGLETEIIDYKRRIRRLLTSNRTYLAKEDLATEHDELLRELLRYIDGLDRAPDLIHAHYADAGHLAASIKQKRGIPFVFTGHSLGAVKRAVTGDDDATLLARVDTEDAVIRSADAIIMSSRDEAERQYPLYPAFDPGKARVISPGSDLQGFNNAEATVAVDEMMGQFLRAPERPAVLAIARPVSKKNLAGLVHAFGQSEFLKRKANLILIAGTRDDVSAMQGECGTNLRQLLHLIDRYDLHGQVALPKTHVPGDIPAIYAWARETRGVFVNPALNEPFGLTLLEAAAAGLPVVATDSGGPNDIIEICKNGRLVSPTNSEDIGAACEEILRSPLKWQRYSARGKAAVQQFDWNAHCRAYHQLAKQLIVGMSGAVQDNAKAMLACDIDNTLIGCTRGVASLAKWRSEFGSLVFGVATGRSFASALAILQTIDLDLPDFIISSVGTEIYYRQGDMPTFERDADWTDWISCGWNRSAAMAVAEQLEDLHPQALLEQREHKLSYFATGGGDIVATLQSKLQAAGVAATVIRSHDQYLDILPPRASKGAAVAHVRRHYRVPEHAVFAAGDSGNDIEMLRSVPNSIIVGNYSDSLAELPELAHAYLAKQSFASGILEGLEFFERQSA